MVEFFITKNYYLNDGPVLLSKDELINNNINATYTNAIFTIVANKQPIISNVGTHHQWDKIIHMTDLTYLFAGFENSFV